MDAGGFIGQRYGEDEHRQRRDDQSQHQVRPEGMIRRSGRVLVHREGPEARQRELHGDQRENRRHQDEQHRIEAAPGLVLSLLADGLGVRCSRHRRVLA